MAIKKQIDIQVNTKEAINNLEALGGKFEQVYGEGVEPLTTQISELEDRLYAMAQAGEAGSAEFKEISQSIASMKKTIISTDMDIDAMTDSLSTNLGGALSGVAGGFSFVQGAMGAMGADSDKLESTLLAVNSAMAMVQGVEGMKQGIRAFKGLKASIMATSVAQKLFGEGTKVATVGMKIFNAVVKSSPIFWLVTAITAVVGAFAWFSSSSEDLEAQNEKLNASFDRQIEKMDRLSNRRKKNAEEASRELEASIKKEIQFLKEKGADAELLRDAELAFEVQRTQQRLKNAEDEEKERVARIKANKDFYRDAAKRRRKAYKEGEYELGDSINNEMKARRKENEQLILLNNEYNTKKIELNTELEIILSKNRENARKDEEAALKARQDRYKAFLQTKEAARKQIEDLTNQAIEDETARAEAVALTKRDRELAAVKGTAKQKAKLRELIEQDYQNTLTKIAEKGIKERQKAEEDAAKVLAKAKEDFAMEEENLSEIIRQAGQTDRQNEIDALNDHYFNLIETAKQHNLDVTALEQEQADKLAAIDKKAADEKKANEKEVLDAKLSMASDTFGALGDLATAFAKDDEKSAERAFKINKAVGIAQAVISTAQGVINAYANPVDVASGVAFGKSAIIAATGAAQIATIAKSKFQGGGAAGSIPTAPSSTAPSAASQPASFNVVGNTGVNQLAETLGNQGQQPIQAFVVGSEVTTQQSLDRNKVETATL